MCYRYVYTQQLPWRDALDVCQQDSADLANMDTQAELESVLLWLNKCTKTGDWYDSYIATL